MIKKLLKILLPQTVMTYLLDIKSNFKLLQQYYYDFSIYSASNGAKLKMNISQIEGKIIAHYHVLEKGISHPTPKNCFSLPVIENLLNLINKYDSICNTRSRQVNVAITVLHKYVSLPTNKKCMADTLLLAINNLQVEEKLDSGYYQFTKDQFFNDSNASFNKFALSRYSVRDFTEENVDLSLLKKAVHISQKTPSVCNRQTAKVYILTNKSDIEKHLALQTGNRGFGDKIDKLLIVTSDLYLFEGYKERNQAFIDGGMFSMSLLYALHALRLGAVPLNWAYDKKQDSALHNLGIIPFNEKIILFIGVGHVPDSFNVAVSNRRELCEVLKIK